ncbi:MAG: formylglycine-generating enzyme family protein, partial [Candidatus Cloacimonetes bacterium]|nr:formylglycine-generating enzyme family protein [Candidatus Cloacimonadota bacterium]
MTKNLLALVFVILATASLCADNFTFSRFEIVEDLTIATSTDGDSVIISWAAIPDVTFYKVYFCYEPYGMYELDLSGEFAGASWSAPVPAASRFYYVTAVYAIPDNFIFVEGGIIYPNNGFYTDGLTVSSFYIDQYELTNAAWEAVMSSGGGDSFPQDNVSWFEAIVYCNRRSM